MKVWKIHLPVIVCFFLVVHTTVWAHKREGNAAVSAKVHQSIQAFLINQPNKQQLQVFERRVRDFVITRQQRLAKSKNHQVFLFQLFYQVHRKFLKHYTLYTTFDALITDGHYDCLTGTALYAIILETLGLPYQVLETEFHIYLKVQTNQGWVLMEATDPLGGFVTDPAAIAQLEKMYRKGHSAGPVAQATPTSLRQELALARPQKGFCHLVTLQQLPGLQYFNAAVVQFNNQQYTATIDLLQKGLAIYRCPRMANMAALAQKLAK